MNTYGDMPDSLRRVVAYQQIGCVFQPGYGDHAFRITLNEKGKDVSDVFYITHDGDVNRAINTLWGRACASD